MKKIFFIILLIGFSLEAQEKDISRLYAGEEYANKFLDSSLKGNEFNIVDKYELVSNEKIAITIAEAVLFDIYGKETITSQKPYEVYKISNYWVIFGTLENRGMMGGGTFKIIISSTDGRIILIGHDK